MDPAAVWSPDLGFTDRMNDGERHGARLSSSSWTTAGSDSPGVEPTTRSATWTVSSGVSGTTTSTMRLTLDYAYNGAGDVTSLGITPPTGTTVTETYTYDGQDRLRRWTASGGATFTHDYVYNSAGDRTSLTDGSDAWTYTHTEDHRLSTYSKPNWAWSVAYDGNGNARWRNQTSGGTTTYEYAYDAEDRITQVKRNGSAIATYSYDGLGRRVKAVEGGTTYLVYSGLSLIQTVAGGTVTRYVYASGLLVARVAAGVTSYVHQDALGSVRATSDANGNWVTSTQYKPFGQEYASQGSSGPLKYTGQQKDPTGLYYLYRRFYDPDLGRFLSQDVILGHLTVPQSLARYTYTVNNPLRYVDPTGEDWWNPWSWGSAIASAGAAVGDRWCGRDAPYSGHGSGGASRRDGFIACPESNGREMRDRRRIAEDFARHVKAKYGDRIEKVILFGSVARGDPREDSDVDLLVVARGDWFALQRDLAGDAVDWLLRSGVYLSAKVFTAEDFARFRDTGFGRNVIAEGVPLA